MLSKEMDARAQDARQLTSDGQKLKDTFLFELISRVQGADSRRAHCVEPGNLGSRLGAAGDRGATVKQEDTNGRTDETGG